MIPDPSKHTRTSSNRPVALIFIPLLSCILTSVFGIVLGQFGNLFYKLAGDAGNALAIPCFCGLFLATAGIAYLITWLLRKVWHPK